jgi:hypothetical protein
MAADDADGPKVKDLLADTAKLAEVVDAATRAELEKWFGLPSFDQLAERGIVAEDPEMVAAREQRERAIAAVEPALLEALRVRAEREILPVRAAPPLHARDIAMIDLDRVERMHVAIAEPRARELPPELEDDLKECTPQALLRDLHRSEDTFDKTFEMVDMAAAQRFDIVAEVASVMSTSWKLPPLGQLPSIEGRGLLAELRRLRRTPSTDIPTPNRRLKD